MAVDEGAPLRAELPPVGAPRYHRGPTTLQDAAGAFSFPARGVRSPWGRGYPRRSRRAVPGSANCHRTIASASRHAACVRMVAACDRERAAATGRAKSALDSGDAKPFTFGALEAMAS